MRDVPDGEVFSGPTKSLMMIDFGRSIDLNFYPKGTTFTNKVNTSCFMCTEMMTERPWTFQVINMLTFLSSLSSLQTV